MSSVSSTVRINDGMSAALRSMNKALNIVLNSFEDLQTVSGNAINTAEIQAARESLNSAAAEAERIAEEMNEISDNTDNANQSLERLNNSMNSGSDMMSGLVKKAEALASAYLGVQTASKLVGLSDEMSRTESRMELIVDDNGSIDELKKKIFASAQRARADYQDTANAVTAFAQRAGEAFNNNDETILFAETLNKMYKIAGASAEEQKSSMLQLTQALGSGVLRGEEFNAVFEAAPNIMQAVADYMEVPLGSLREMAQDGEISAEVVKNAIFNATNQVNQDFEGMRLTWSDVATSIRNEGLMALQPVLDKISELANNPTVQQFGQIMINNVTNIGNAILWIIEQLAMVSSFMIENWSTIEPILVGVTAALLTYNLYMAIANGNTILATASAIAHNAALMAKAVVMGLVAIATGDAAMMQTALNVAMAASPIGWLMLAIGLLVTVIYNWVKAVGGVRIAWLTVVNSVLTAWDTLKLGFMIGIYSLLNFLDNLSYGWQAVTVGIANFVGAMKVNVLTLLQEMINGAIDLINDFIEACNDIPFVSIDTIAHVTFATTAAAEEEAARQAREAGLSEMDQRIAEKEQIRDRKIQTMADELVANKAEREDEIDLLREEARRENEETEMPEAPPIPDIPEYSEIAGNTGDTADNTKNMLEITDEDLRYLKDIAEQETINRFTTAEIKLEMTNNNNINSDMDIDGFVSKLEDKLYESMVVAAEGVH